MSTRLIDHCAPAVGAGFEAPEFECVQASTVSNVFVNVLDIIGGGCVYLLSSTMSDLAGEIQVTVDGYVATRPLSTTLRYLIFHNLSDAAGLFLVTGINFDMNFWFQDNLKVEHRVTTGVTAYTKIHYGVL